MKKRKLLVVGMPFSMHVVRWLSLLEDSDWEVHFFSSFPYRHPHHEMKNIIFHNYFYNYCPRTSKTVIQKDYYNRRIIPRSSFINKWIGKGFRYLKWQKNYQYYLQALIEKLRPDIVHSMESQHGGYLVSRVYKEIKIDILKPLWIHTTFGIDLDYFMHFPDHRQSLKEMFAGIDVYIAEGNRDINYAKELEYRKANYIFPSAGGGYIIEDFTNKNRSRPSQRKKILVKGYHDTVRRGLVAVRALVRCKEMLENYEICVYSCAPEMKEYIQYVNSKENMKIKVLADTNYQGWLDCLAEARVSITNNLSDGIPSSFFESMLMGVFPIQSESSCTDEWIENGVSGFIVSPEDPEWIEKALREAVTNNEMVDKAAEINFKKVSSCLEFNKVKKEVIKMYSEVLSC